MSNVELAETRLTFEDLLEAVQDSKRGRWFLQEYESRIQKRDTTSILAAISKLESRMDVLGPQASSPDDLAKVKTAISNARNDLFKLGLGKEAMSKEGRLFAELAEMARKATPEIGEQNAGIVRTLQLVDEIDRTISPAADAGAKFFVADANLFDRPAASKPVLVEVAAAPVVETVAAPVVEVEPARPVVAETPKPVSAKKEEPVATGAKLVIRKVNASAPVEAEVVPPVMAEEPKAAPVEVAPVAAAPEAMPTSELPKSSIQATENPRIVIIRRRAEDMPEASVSGASAA
jgi:hypothetical protein